MMKEKLTIQISINGIKLNMKLFSEGLVNRKNDKSRTNDTTKTSGNVNISTTFLITFIQFIVRQNAIKHL